MLDYSKQKTTALHSQVNSQQNHISLLPSTYHLSPYHLLPSFCKYEWDWSNALQEWVGLVQLSVGMGGIDPTFCKNGWDWSNFLQE